MFRDRRALVAVGLFLTLALAGLSPLAQAAPLTVPLDDVNTSQTTEPAAELATDPVFADPWWPAWLEEMDEDGDLVDDRAEAEAQRLIDAGTPEAPVVLLVNYDHYPTPVEAFLLQNDHDAEIIWTFHRIPTIEARVPAVNVESVGEALGVTAVEWSPPIVAMNDVASSAMQAREWSGGGSNAIYNGDTAEILGYSGQGQVIAVLDTGVEDTHPAFSGKWVEGALTTAGTTGCVNPADDDGHGTHVAGSALGNDPATTAKGTATGARLVEIKISASAGATSATFGGIERGFEWLADYNDGTSCHGPPGDDRVDVATVSFGSTSAGGSSAGSAEALIKALNQQGVVVTIAVGNCGPSPSAVCSQGYSEYGISSPGNAAGAIGVANINDGNTVNRGNDAVSSSSSRGPNQNSGSDPVARHLKPDVGAPGTNINSANVFYITGPDYVSFSGTSMATPLTAGASAILLGVGESVKAQTGGVNLMAPTDTGFAGGAHDVGAHPVREALVNGADYRTAGTASNMVNKWERPGIDGNLWNNAWGYGEVNVFAAICWSFQNILVPGGATPPQIVQDTCQLGSGVIADAGGPYTGQPGAAVALSAAAVGGTAPFTFEWDLDNDGAFDDAVGATPSVTFVADGAWPVSVQVTDSLFATDTDTATVTITSPGGGVEEVIDSWTFDSEECDSTTDGEQEGWFWSRPITPEPNGAPTDWHAQTFASHSGACSWYHGDDAAGVSPHNQITDLHSPADDCLNIPATYESARLEFYVAGELESDGTNDWDTLDLEVRTSGCDFEGWSSGGSLIKLSGVQGNLFSDPPVYVPYDGDLTSFIGAGDFQVRFRVRTDTNNIDCSDATGTLCPGFQLDTFTLYGTKPGTGNLDDITDLAASNGAQIPLSWTPPTGATAQTIHRSDTSGFTPTAGNQIGSVPGTDSSFTDLAPLIGTNHYVVVASATGDTSVSNGASAISSVTDTTPPTAFTLTVTDPNTDGELDVSWTASSDPESGISSYNIYRATATTPTIPDDLLATVAGTETLYVDAGLTNGDTYHYIVEAVNGVSLTTLSNEDTATPSLDVTPPPQVTGLVATASPGQVELAWDASTAADIKEYNVYRDAAPLATTALTSLLDASVTNGQTYCYYVEAVDLRDNVGTPSATVCATPELPPVPPLIGWPQFHRDPALTGVSVDGGVISGTPDLFASTPLGAATLSGAVWGNIDADPEFEIVIGTRAIGGITPAQLVAFDTDGTSLTELWRTDMPTALTFTEGYTLTPALVESGDGDAAFEIVAAYNYAANGGQLVSDHVGGISLVDGDGTILSSFTLGILHINTNPIVSNVDTDDAPEVVIGEGNNGGSLHIYEAASGQLTQQDTFPTCGAHGIKGTVALADVSGDGLPEIVAPAGRFGDNALGGVCIYDGTAGEIVTVQLSVGIHGVAVADLDTDGVAEIVATGRTDSSTRTTMNILDTTSGPTGYTLAQGAKAGYLWSAPSIGDVDGDGLPEIVAINTNEFIDDTDHVGSIHIYEYAAGTLSQVATLARGGTADPIDRESPGGAVLMNTDIDPQLEIVLGSMDGNVSGYSLEAGVIVEDWSHTMDGAVSAPPAVGDVTGDGKADVIIADESTNSLVILGTPNGPPTLDPIGDVFVDEGAVLDVDITASDPDGDALTITAIVGSPDLLAAGATFQDLGSGIATLDWNTDFDDEGVYPLTIEVSDGSFTDSETLNVNVLHVNQLPVIDPIGPSSTDENVQIVIGATANDADGDPLTLTASATPDLFSMGASFTQTGSNTGTLSWTPGYDDAGIYVVTIHADDGEDVTDEVFQLAVNNVDRAPVLGPIPNQATRENLNLAFGLTASDPDGNAIAFSATSLPSWLTLTDNGDGTAAVAGTPAPGDAGSYSVTFVAASGSPALDDSQVVNIDVGVANVPPAITAPTEVVVDAGGVAAFTAIVADSDGPEPLTVTASNAPGVFPAPTFTDNNDGTWTWSWITTDTTPAGTTVTLTADDGLDSTQSTTQILVRRAPSVLVPEQKHTICGGERTLASGTALTGAPIELIGYASDPDGSIAQVLFYPEGFAGPSIAGVHQGSTVYRSVAYTYTTPGTYTVGFMAVDDDGLESMDSTTLVVSADQSPTGVSAGDDFVGEAEGPMGLGVTLSGTGTDPEGCSVSFEWALPASAGGATLNGNDVTYPFPVGSHPVMLTVTDGNGLSTTDTVTVAVDDAIFGAVMLDGRAADGSMSIVDSLLVRHTGTIIVTDDALNPVSDATFTGEVYWYGVEGGMPVMVASFDGTTEADGTANYDYHTELIGMVDPSSVAPLPGYHEIVVSFQAASRAGSPDMSPETAMVVLGYSVGV